MARFESIKSTFYSLILLFLSSNLKLFIVSLIPWRKLIEGSQPILFILLVSSSFLGVPSGFEESHFILPLNPISFEINSANPLILISSPLPTFKKDNFSLFVFCGESLADGSQFSRTNKQAFERSSTCKNSLLGNPDPQQVTDSRLYLFASSNFLISAGRT